MENIKKIMLYSAMITVSIAIVSSTYADDTTSSGSMTNSGSIVNSTTSTGVIDTTTSTGTTTTTNTGTTVDGASTTTSTGVIVGGDKDNHGCIGSAGYTWCGSKNKCIRSWEEKCEVTKEVQENWVEFHENYGFLKDYFKKDLNIDQKKAVLKLMQDHMKAVKNLLKSAKDLVKNNNFDKIAFDESVKTMISKHIEEILPYIDSTKVDKFKLFMEERQKTVIENIKVKNEMKKPSDTNKPKKDEIKKQIKKFLPQKTLDTFNKKLDSIKTEKKQEFFTKLLKKIDKLISSTKNEKIKGMLEELKSITQEKINEPN